MIAIETMTDMAVVDAELRAVEKKLEALNDQAGQHLIGAALAQDRMDTKGQAEAQSALAKVMEEKGVSADRKRDLEAQKSLLQRLVTQRKDGRKLAHFVESVRPAIPRYQKSVDTLDEDLKKAALALFKLAQQGQELFQEYHREFSQPMQHGRAGGVDVPGMRTFNLGSLKMGNAYVKDMIAASLEILESPGNNGLFKIVISQMEAK